MAVTTTTNKVIYSGNGATTAWSYTFPILSASDLSVIYTDTTGAESTISSSAYTVTGIGSPSGGTVTYPTSGSPIASGTKLTILRTVPYTQTDVFSNQGGYYPEVTEGRFDRIVMALQQLYERSLRSFLAPASDSTAPGAMPTSTQRANGGAGSFLAFNSSGNPYAASLTALSGVSTWIQNNLLPAASASAARTAIAVPGLGDNNTYTGTNTFNGDVTLGSGLFTGVGSQSVISYLGGNVNLVAGNTFYDGPNTGSIGANGQIWLIIASGTINNAASAVNGEITIWNGSTYLTAGQMFTTGAATFTGSSTCMAVVTLTGATTFTLRAANNAANGVLIAATAIGGRSGTYIAAVRLK